MRKKICVQEADEVEIRFRDRSYLATFNMRAIRFLQEVLQDTKLEDISYEHYAMALTMRPSDIGEIVESYVRSVNGIGISENEEKLKKAIAQMIGGKAGQ